MIMGFNTLFLAEQVCRSGFMPNVDWPSQGSNYNLQTPTLGPTLATARTTVGMIASKHALPIQLMPMVLEVLATGLLMP